MELIIPSSSKSRSAGVVGRSRPASTRLALAKRGSVRYAIRRRRDRCSLGEKRAGLREGAAASEACFPKVFICATPTGQGGRVYSEVSVLKQARRGVRGGRDRGLRALPKVENASAARRHQGGHGPVGVEFGGWRRCRANKQNDASRCRGKGVSGEAEMSREGGRVREKDSAHDATRAVPGRGDQSIVWGGCFFSSLMRRGLAGGSSVLARHGARRVSRRVRRVRTARSPLEGRDGVCRRGAVIENCTRMAL